MKRKLIKQGGSGLTLYLPKKWIDKKHLKAGDEIEIEEIENQLIISTEKKVKEEKQISIELNSSDKGYIKALLNNLYRKSYTKINLDTKKQEIKPEILYNITEQLLLGFEITHAENNIYTFEIVSEPIEKEEIILRRIFLILKEQFKLIEENNQENNIIIKKNYEKVKRYDNYCRRIVSNQKDAGPKWVLLSLLLQVNSNLNRLSKNLKQTPKEIIELGNIFNNLYEGYYKKNIKQTKNASIKSYELYDKLLEGKCKNEKATFFYITELSRLLVLTHSAIIALMV